MPSKGRRGTKFDPFVVGDKVISRRKGSEGKGEVLEVEPADYGGHIAYRVRVEDVGTLWLYARDLVEDTDDKERRVTDSSTKRDQ